MACHGICHGTGHGMPYGMVTCAHVVECKFSSEKYRLSVEKYQSTVSVQKNTGIFLN